MPGIQEMTGKTPASASQFEYESLSVKDGRQGGKYPRRTSVGMKAKSEMVDAG
jgi:hypothetical protein